MSISFAYGEGFMSACICQNLANCNFKYMRLGAHQLCLNRVVKKKAIDLEKIFTAHLFEKELYAICVCACVHVYP